MVAVGADWTSDVLQQGDSCVQLRFMDADDMAVET